MIQWSKLNEGSNFKSKFSENFIPPEMVGSVFFVEVLRQFRLGTIFIDGQVELYG